MDGLLVNDTYVLWFNCLILMVHISSHVILCIIGLLRGTGKVRNASSHHGYKGSDAIRLRKHDKGSTRMNVAYLPSIESSTPYLNQKD